MIHVSGAGHLGVVVSLVGLSGCAIGSAEAKKRWVSRIAVDCIDDCNSDRVIEKVAMRQSPWLAGRPGDDPLVLAGSHHDDLAHLSSSFAAFGDL